MAYKLGKLPFVRKATDLHFRDYRDRSIVLPVPPAAFGHDNLVPSFPMLGNDEVGDCVIAGIMHLIQVWTAMGGNPAIFTTANALADYSAITGYDPNNPDSDQGTDMRTALQYGVDTGFIDANGNRHKIGAFMLLQSGNLQELAEAVYLFGGAATGFQLPESAQEQFSDGQTWDVVPGSPIEGGHCAPVVARLMTGSLDLVTWGKEEPATPAFIVQYCDEPWAVLSPEMMVNGVTMDGFNLAQLHADWNALPRGG
jgi:hypothetical protein